jgi:hypothetical protein
MKTEEKATGVAPSGSDDRATAGARRFPRAAVIAALACVVVLIAGGTVVAWNRWWRRAGPSNPSENCPAVVAGKGRRPFTASGVHRVALIGDSIMVQPSCAIADSLAGIGVTTYRDAVSGTGLLNGDVDWLAATKAILRTQRPDVVVAIFVGNYWAPGITDTRGVPIKVDTPAFFAAWQQRAVQLSSEVRAAHARLYWVSPPPIALPPLKHAQQLFQGYERIPGDHVLDSGRVVGGAGDKEVASKQTCGHVQVVRSPVDFTHLTETGARIYGQQIAHDLSADLGLFTSPRPC